MDTPNEETPKRKELEFNLKPVKKIPKRQYRKGSKYEPILTEFLKMNVRMVDMQTPEGQDKTKYPNYLRTQLKKRIEATPRVFGKITVSVVNNVIYLERSDIE